MIFEQIATGGCQSYLVGCPETCQGALIDPELGQVDRYQTLAAKVGVGIPLMAAQHLYTVSTPLPELAGETIEVSQTSDVSGASKFIVVALPYLPRMTALLSR